MAFLKQQARGGVSARTVLKTGLGDDDARVRLRGSIVQRIRIQDGVMGMPIDLVQCVLIAAQGGLKYKRHMADCGHVLPKTVWFWLSKSVL